MQVWTTQHGDVTVVHWQGQMGYSAVEANSGRLADLLSKTGPHIVVDLSEVSVVSSAGLRWLLELRQNRVDRGGDVVVAGASHNIESLLRDSHLDRVFRMFATVDQAVADV